MPSETQEFEEVIYKSDACKHCLIRDRKSRQDLPQNVKGYVVCDERFISVDRFQKTRQRTTSLSMPEEAAHLLGQLLRKTKCLAPRICFPDGYLGLQTTFDAGFNEKQPGLIDRFLGVIFGN